MAAFLYLHRGHEEVEGRLFIAIHGRRMRNTGHKLKQSPPMFSRHDG